jgi:hypothetical protein
VNRLASASRTRRMRASSRSGRGCDRWLGEQRSQCPVRDGEGDGGARKQSTSSSSTTARPGRDPARLEGLRPDQPRTVNDHSKKKAIVG